MDRTGSGLYSYVSSVRVSSYALGKLVLDNICQILKTLEYGGNTVSHKAEEEIQAHVFTFFRFRFDVLYCTGK